MRRRTMSAMVVVAAMAAGPATRPAVPTVNQAVLKYAAAQVGKRVGNGECTSLAQEAFRAAGAQRNRGYTWGRKLGDKEPVLPGDVLQFTSCVFQHTVGRTWTKTTLGLPHHTAIVRAVKGPTRYDVLQQNPGPVTAMTIDFHELISGTWQAYRPVPLDDDDP